MAERVAPRPVRVRTQKSTIVPVISVGGGYYNTSVCDEPQTPQHKTSEHPARLSIPRVRICGRQLIGPKFIAPPSNVFYRRLPGFCLHLQSDFSSRAGGGRGRFSHRLKSSIVHHLTSDERPHKKSPSCMIHFTQVHKALSTAPHRKLPQS